MRVLACITIVIDYKDVYQNINVLHAFACFQTISSKKASCMMTSFSTIYFTIIFDNSTDYLKTAPIVTDKIYADIIMLSDYSYIYPLINSSVLQVRE